MITIKNLLNNPLMVGGKSLGVNGEIKVKAVTDEISRLAAKSFVSIVEPETGNPPPPPTEPNKSKENK